MKISAGATFGKNYKIARADGKVTSNPARLVEQRDGKQCVYSLPI
jgi:hypothetical protein